ncbi:MAG: antibiotic biosynthesis monooxygenase [Myxococcota bacterium]
MNKQGEGVAPLLVVADFVFTAEGEAEFMAHRDRTLAEVRGVEGCIQAVLWARPGRRFQFSTLWVDAAAVTRWVENEFHRTVLMPGFRKWCTEGCFGEYTLAQDHKRARKCAACGRWTQDQPGWDESRPSACGACGGPLEQPADA